tara:strand:- start:842 stop:988 length:147 start_codon:yes stop_codon:yes gene_type:complete
MANIRSEKNRTIRKYLGTHNTYNKITASINRRLKREYLHHNIFNKGLG